MMSCAPFAPPDNLEQLDAEQLRALVVAMSQQLQHMQALIEQLKLEQVLLNRRKFVLQSERHQRSPEEQRELEEAIEADLQAVQDKLRQLQPEQAVAPEAQMPRRAALPAELPRRDIHHEPAQTSATAAAR